MHRASTGRWLNRALRIGNAPSSTIPIFLCPAIARCGPAPIRHGAIQSRRFLQSNVSSETTPLPVLSSISTTATEEAPRPDRRLPLTCTGCGAFSQTEDPNYFGYYDLGTKRVKTWVRPKRLASRIVDTAEEDRVVQDSFGAVDTDKLQELGIDPSQFMPSEDVPDAPKEKTPICERCHNLVHHSVAGESAKIAMFHPTVESLRETIEESPHKYNHIYHVIDAADFPMSLVPRLNVLLGDIPIRTKNRRSRSGKFVKDRQTELSFIITRGDLLGPTKEAVDTMMPYLREVLREALGRLGNRVRLGNTRCVSAKRGWWVRTVKDDIWKRGGAGWMVGKVNVGKSKLFEEVYPKGRFSDPKLDKVSIAAYPKDVMGAESRLDSLDAPEYGLDDVDVGTLLPPAREPELYPQMPLVSSLPGTTASPIRIPFGNGKGELIDLPGLSRSDLELFVKEENRQDLIMQTRVIPEQVSLTSQHSILLGGGLIRITPRTPDLTFLMYNFTPLEEHLTSTDKAVAFSEQTRESPGVHNITLPEMGSKMKHAGTFKLTHDVTRRRAGPLTTKSAVNLRVEKLHFRVLSLDILIEGVGYVEIVAQVRAKNAEQMPRLQPSTLHEDPLGRDTRRRAPSETSDDPFASLTTDRRDSRIPSQAPTRAAAIADIKPVVDIPPHLDWPAVDVFTPEGRFVGSRQPINGWLTNKPLVKKEHKRSRPRRSMKGQKKAAKIRARAE